MTRFHFHKTGPNNLLHPPAPQFKMNAVSSLINTKPLFFKHVQKSIFLQLCAFQCYIYQYWQLLLPQPQTPGVYVPPFKQKRYREYMCDA